MADGYWRYTEHEAAAKRPRTQFDMAPPAQAYFGHDPVIRDTHPPTSSYERYLISGQIAAYGGLEPARSAHPIDRFIEPKSRPAEVVSLPPDASNTLFVEGLPADCKEREVAHIFRPFVGYKEVRLVTKESRRRGGDPLVLCFVDFVTPAHAATALDALQGYKFDEHDRDSVKLKLQFSRFPGARSGGGHRGKR